MLLSWETRLFFAALVASCGYALWQGGRTERAGAAAFLLASLASGSAHVLARSYTPTAALMVIDLALLLTLVTLAWRSSRSWPAIAAGPQAAAIAAHVAYVAELGGSARVYLTALAVASYAQLLALAVGVWRRKRALRSAG